MSTTNPLISKWRAGQTTFGVWATMPSSITAEFIARQGLDYVCVDYQHGLIEHTVGVAMMQGIEAGGAIPIARVNWNEPNRIMQVLDAGARGVVVPMVNTADEAARAARAFRFPPQGDRSYGPVRSRETLGTGDTDVIADQACIVMIETADGIKNVHEIAATPGVDALYIGPSDLALAMGLAPNHTPPDAEFVRVIDEIKRACLDNGIAPGIQCANGEIAARYAEAGFQLITIASDAPLLTNAVKANLALARRANANSLGQPASNY